MIQFTFSLTHRKKATSTVKITKDTRSQESRNKNLFGQGSKISELCGLSHGSVCPLQHESASVQMFDHLVKKNLLEPEMEKYGLILPEDLIFIKELIAGPKDALGDDVQVRKLISCGTFSLPACVLLV